jgi:hypothetical protein
MPPEHLGCRAFGGLVVAHDLRPVAMPEAAPARQAPRLAGALCADGAAIDEVSPAPVELHGDALVEPHRQFDGPRPEPETLRHFGMHQLVGRDVDAEVRQIQYHPGAQRRDECRARDVVRQAEARRFPVIGRNDHQRPRDRRAERLGDTLARRAQGGQGAPAFLERQFARGIHAVVDLHIALRADEGARHPGGRAQRADGKGQCRREQHQSDEFFHAVVLKTERQDCSNDNRQCRKTKL